MLVLVKQAISGATSLDDIEDKLAKIAECSYIPTSRTREALVSGWEKAVEHFLEDGNLDPSEEKCLETFQDRFSGSSRPRPPRVLYETGKGLRVT